MKNKDFNLVYSLRQLLFNKEIQSIIKYLFKEKNNTKELSIYLPLLNECINKTIEKAYPLREEFNLDHCFSLEDMTFLKELEKSRTIAIRDMYEKESSEGMGLGYVVEIVIKNSNSIERLYEWIIDSPLIINYGIFSLHTFTGEAYCLDNKYNFHTNKGLFRVFRTFLQEQSHMLTYEKIYKTFQDSDSNKFRYGSEDIHQIIGEIREKLQMKGKLSKLFLPSSDKYILKSF